MLIKRIRLCLHSISPCPTTLELQACSRWIWAVTGGVLTYAIVQALLVGVSAPQDFLRLPIACPLSSLLVRLDNCNLACDGGMPWPNHRASGRRADISVVIEPLPKELRQLSQTTIGFKDGSLTSLPLVHSIMPSTSSWSLLFQI